MGGLPLRNLPSAGKGNVAAALASAATMAGLQLCNLPSAGESDAVAVVTFAAPMAGLLLCDPPSAGDRDAAAAVTPAALMAGLPLGHLPSAGEGDAVTTVASAELMVGEGPPCGHPSPFAAQEDAASTSVAAWKGTVVPTWSTTVEKPKEGNAAADVAAPATPGTATCHSGCCSEDSVPM